MAPHSIEERLSQVENNLAHLLRRTRTGFLDTMIGLHANGPMFTEARYNAA